MKAFTLIEILVVLAIVALGWWWLPGLINTKATSPQNHFDQTLEQFVAHARMEGIARQQIVAFGVIADGSQISVGINSGGSFEPIAKTSIDASIVFDKGHSSGSGNSGVFTITNDSLGNFWRVWWFDINGKPTQSGGTLIWSIDASPRTWIISDEGALIPQ